MRAHHQHSALSRCAFLFPLFPRVYARIPVPIPIALLLALLAPTFIPLCASQRSQSVTITWDPGDAAVCTGDVVLNFVERAGNGSQIGWSGVLAQIQRPASNYTFTHTWPDGAASLSVVVCCDASSGVVCFGTSTVTAPDQVGVNGTRTTRTTVQTSTTKVATATTTMSTVTGSASQLSTTAATTSTLSTTTSTTTTTILSSTTSSTAVLLPSTSKPPSQPATANTAAICALTFAALVALVLPVALLVRGYRAKKRRGGAGVELGMKDKGNTGGTGTGTRTRKGRGDGNGEGSSSTKGSKTATGGGTGTNPRTGSGRRPRPLQRPIPKRRDSAVGSVSSSSGPRDKGRGVGCGGWGVWVVAEGEGVLGMLVGDPFFATIAAPLNQINEVYVDVGEPRPFVVVGDFLPTGPDEIRLKEGDRVHLVIAYRDGWGQGENLRSGKRGMLPLNFLYPEPGSSSTLARFWRRARARTVSGDEEHLLPPRRVPGISCVVPVMGLPELPRNDSIAST
ncbi:hypothetical protein M427DRAFT_147832 [Gonapodya prolifera JEL478]|uniref:SH3 domain-containing protein n=1 Tax=Gonapodya prolifera (strain JEL478) TaxID=1344416 RepID=A0A139A3D9_GONPJ|nr:hypothetical protein M427DRAFT_147832 [Gonapodya prolifera JEL478]|eukprot:KXS11312.1 hypothetical protein M427DRAFT_147832 [Gonapodya prolifera JEL478]